MKWDIKYLPEAEDDLNELDGSLKAQILKGIRKVSKNPVSNKEGGYGKPLGNKAGTNLTGLYKIKFLGIGQRVVYALQKSETKMTVIIISARADDKVYKEAEKRRKENNL
jgi:mRNA interferase RelE/StbE